MAKKTYDFAGWATKNDLRCSDGRTIRKGAFAHNDGCKVPLVWNHMHSGADNVLGYAILHNEDQGVRAYGYFNDTDAASKARMIVQHGDIVALSIYANHLQQSGKNVLHGDIKEVSLVLAGANPGALIDEVLIHGDIVEGEAVIYTGEEDTLTLHHSDDIDDLDETEDLEHSDEETGDSIADIVNSMTDEQKQVMQMYAQDQVDDAIGKVIEALEEEEDDEDDDDETEEEEEMKHNVFESDVNGQGAVLSHADEEAIMSLAKATNVGSLQTALEIYANDSNNETLAHAFDDGDLEALFPEYKDVKPGEPELITRDYSWVDKLIAGVHKSPIPRIRTRQFDARQTGIRAKGYVKKAEKGLMGNPRLLSRTTDPQTVYVKDKLNRDDILDITDFDVVRYQYKIMRGALNEELALAITVGDGREDGDPDKIDETHVRSIWHDDDLYTIHADVDIEAARTSLQGTDTAANFSENYVYAEAIIMAALYARENYKGSGALSFYCTPHLLNVMLLARDLNGRRIYESKADLAAALNVKEIETVEQFEGLTRSTGGNNPKTKKLLGIFVNLSDYQVGAAKGGEITSFNQFDMDFNQEKYLMETRVSGALIKPYSAIALEEDVTASGNNESGSGSGTGTEG